MANNYMNRRGGPNYNENARTQQMMRTESSVNFTNNSSGNNSAACEEMLKAIAEAAFFAQDLKLYLDTHPEDTRAIEMYTDAVKQYMACKAAFEDSFYPLFAMSAGKNGEWDWLCGDFPPLS